MLTADQSRSLRYLANMMIPANAEYAMRSAGDDTIFADILRSFGRDAEHVLAVLRTLDEMAGGIFADLEPARRRRRYPTAQKRQRVADVSKPDNPAMLLPGQNKRVNWKCGYSTVMSPVMPAQSWSAHHML
jgi:hypothetical protein